MLVLWFLSNAKHRKNLADHWSAPKLQFVPEVFILPDQEQFPLK
jgi:hypothetical protein